MNNTIAGKDFKNCMSVILKMLRDEEESILERIDSIHNLRSQTDEMVSRLIIT